MSASPGGTGKIREIISTANEICNFVRQQQGLSSRMGSTILHVTDVTSCVAKLYLDRSYDPSGVCYQLIKMFQGKMLEQASAPRFCSLGYEYEPTYGGLLQTSGQTFPRILKYPVPGHGLVDIPIPVVIPPKASEISIPGVRGRPKGLSLIDVKRRMLEERAKGGAPLPPDISFDVNEEPIPTLGVHATPDFVYPTSAAFGAPAMPQIVLEMSQIGYALPLAHFMAMQQARFLRNLGVQYAIPLPPLSDPRSAGLYPDDPLNFPTYLFLNHLIQIAAYREAVSRGKPLVTKFLAIYTNAEVEHVFKPEHLSEYYALFKTRLAPATFAITRGTVVPRLQQSTIIERSVQRQAFDEDVFKILYFYELRTPGILLASIQCPTCPYYSIGVCPGIPPMREPKAEFGDWDRLRHFLEARKWIPSTHLRQEELDVIAAATGEERRAAYVEWLQEVLSAVPRPPTLPSREFPTLGVDWTGVVSAGNCDLKQVAGQMPSFTPAGQSERAAPPNP